MSSPTTRSPEDHASVARLSAIDLADAAAVIESRTNRIWIKLACGEWAMGQPGATVERLGVYAMQTDHGQPVPALLVLVRRAARGRSLPARAAVVMVYRAGLELQVSDWTITPEGEPKIRGQRLAD